MNVIKCEPGNDTLCSGLGKENEYFLLEKAMLDKKTSGEIDCQYMDYEKVYSYLKWEPRFSFQQGLSQTIEWYRHYLENRITK